MRQLIGFAASSGYALGHACRLITVQEQVNAAISPPSAVAEELKRFGLAVQRAGQDLMLIREQLAAQRRQLEVDIIDVQLLLLEDPEFVGSARERIAGGVSSLDAVRAIKDETIEAMLRLDDPYLRERTLDIEDLASRIAGELRGEKSLKERLAGVNGAILLCEDLKPSEAVQLDPAAIAGVAASRGSRTSHFAIIARSIGIPVIVGIGEELSSIDDGQLLLLDGYAGVLTADPHESLLLQHRGRGRRERLLSMPLSPERPDRRPGTSQSEQKLPALLANIRSVGEAQTAIARGAEGIGLFRTEFLFLGRHRPPSEEEQYSIYREVASAFNSGPGVTIRTMDAGGDKPLPYEDMPREDNPAMGLRGIRYSLLRQELLRQQLRALLRASAWGRIRLLLPMIATLGELREFRTVLEEIRQELDRSGLSYDRHMEVGVMIEVPSAALIADKLAEEADFLSIGSNDLTQFTMAACRVSPQLHALNDSLQPAVLQLIKHTVLSARVRGKRVSLCGEMGVQPLAIPLLLGFGMDELSVGGDAIHTVRWMMRQLANGCSGAELADLANRAADMDSAEDVRRALEERFPMLVRVNL